MKTKDVLSITEARQCIYEIADRVQKPGSHVVLTQNGRATMVMLSAQEYDSMAETLEVMAILPNPQEEMRKAWDEYARGEFVTLETLAEKYEGAKKNKPVSRGISKVGRKVVRKTSKRRSGKSS